MHKDDLPIKLPISWVVPRHIASRYSNNILVQHTEDEFVVSFFELHPPVLLSDMVEMPETVEAECVARVILSEKKLEQFIGALQSNLDTFRAKRDADKDVEDGTDNV